MSHRQMIEPMLFFWKLYVDGNGQGISNQVEKSCLNINKPTIKVIHGFKAWKFCRFCISRFYIMECLAADFGFFKNESWVRKSMARKHWWSEWSWGKSKIRFCQKWNYVPQCHNIASIQTSSRSETFRQTNKNDYLWFGFERIHDSTCCCRPLSIFQRKRFNQF